MTIADPTQTAVLNNRSRSTVNRIVAMAMSTSFSVDVVNRERWSHLIIKLLQYFQDVSFQIFISTLNPLGCSISCQRRECSAQLTIILL